MVVRPKIWKVEGARGDTRLVRAYPDSLYFLYLSLVSTEKNLQEKWLQKYTTQVLMNRVACFRQDIQQTNRFSAN